MKRTIIFGILTLIGGLLGAFVGSFMTGDRAAVACYIVGSVAIPYPVMWFLAARRH